LSLKLVIKLEYIEELFNIIIVVNSTVSLLNLIKYVKLKLGL